MIQVVYYNDSKAIKAWNRDEAHFGYPESDKWTVTIIDFEPDLSPENYLFDEVNNTLMLDPDMPIPEPPCSIHIGRIVSINVDLARPVKISREWRGNVTQHSCLATEGLKDQYLQGDVKIGDYVLVDCQDDHVCEYIVIAKIFKSW